MLTAALAFAAALAPLQTDSHLSVAQILSRVAEEAEVFYQNAPKSLSEETLQQRALLPPSRFRPRIGAAAKEPDKPRLQVREIVSEYTVGTLRSSDSGDLVEFRQVVSVDGHPVQSAGNARHALSLGVHSPDDRIRKRMLENFASHGLVDVATDYGLILLAFTHRGMAHMQIEPVGEDRLGADAALVLSWRQTTPAGGQLEFNGRQAVRQPLQGKLWVRRSDGLPLRIDARAQFPASGHTVRDEATVEYTMCSHGFLTPASVLHRHIVDGRLITENRYTYGPFKLFTAETDINFSQVPDPPPARK